MTAIIDPEDIKKAADLLKNKYEITKSLMKKVFCKDKEWLASIIATNKKLVEGKIAKKPIADEEFYAFIVAKMGFSLFSGRKDPKKAKEKKTSRTNSTKPKKKKEQPKDITDIRNTILQHLDENTINELYSKFRPDGKLKERIRKAKDLAEHKWSNGKRWANDFVKAAGFPQVFAGIPKHGELKPTIEKINPKPVLPALVEFQLPIKEKMKEILEGEGNNTRCMVTLPTGTGKTRIAVEAFVEWMQPKFSQGLYMIWIAQSEELCDQAAKCIKDIWENREFVKPLHLIRYYRGSEATLDILDAKDALNGGVVVAGIHQLYHRIKDNDDVVKHFIKNCGAVIIDEAHRADTKMYDTFFDKAKEEEMCGDELFPVCGLSATPGRGNNPERMEKLVGRFEVKLIEPQLGESDGYDSNNPLKYFKEKEYLAKARHRIVINGIPFEFPEKSSKAKRQELHDALKKLKEINGEDEILLKHLAKDINRNFSIIKILCEIPSDSSTLVYTCSVEHAEILSAMMNRENRKSAYVSSDTSTTERQMIIDDFKKGKINYIFNYGVLTTGFDAPKTDHIVLCRPITTDVLYEQIVGRGMRGPKFGGTAECVVIDFEDTFLEYGEQQSYNRYKHFWDGGEETTSISETNNETA